MRDFIKRVKAKVQGWLGKKSPETIRPLDLSDDIDKHRQWTQYDLNKLQKAQEDSERRKKAEQARHVQRTDNPDASVAIAVNRPNIAKLKRDLKIAYTATDFVAPESTPTSSDPNKSVKVR